jgi:N utilization substance protein B
MQALYQIDLTKTPVDEVLNFHWYDRPLDDSQKQLASELVKGVVKNWEVLDRIISTYSKNRELARISIVNKCILRLSIFSLINQREIPPKVVINEGVELTREFESEESVSFINGILDAIYKDELESEKELGEENGANKKE